MNATTAEQIALHVTVNGAAHTLSIDPGERLSAVLRRAGYLGVKHGCYRGDCGSCTVLLDGAPIAGCLKLAAQVEGRALTTVEGLRAGAALHPLQRAFLDEGAAQCGFCTPGMLLSALSLLDRVHDPDEAEVRHALSGNLCRCTGYEAIVRAVLNAARALREDRS